MQKIDYKKTYSQFYAPKSGEISQIDVPAFQFLMIDGQGDPNSSPDYAHAVEALFSVAYKAKFIIKKEPEGLDYAVMPLEGLWWADDMSAFTTTDKHLWKWTMMIMQPACVTPSHIERAQAEVSKKKPSLPLKSLRLETFTEGLCAQALHVGPFSEEGPLIERIHAFIAAKSELSGKHHEIYLSNIRRADPARWKTIIRQPMKT